MGFDGLKDLLAQLMLCFFTRWRKDRIVVSSRIRSLIMPIPTKRRMVGT
jgi:hypothetical protein